MTARLAIVNKFLDAYWHDGHAVLAELVGDDFQWDNVAFHSFERVGNALLATKPLLRKGLAGLGSRNSMAFRDVRTGESVLQDDDGGHEVLNQAELSNGTVMQERYDLTRVRGVMIRMHCVGIFEFAGDRIVEWRDFFEIQHWHDQLALLGLEYGGYATD